MTTTSFEDAVCIDTNIFEHLFNPCKNVDGHINGLLGYLQKVGVALLVDDHQRMASEYSHRLIPIIRCNDDLSNEVQLLRYWVMEAPWLSTTIDLTDRLMEAIKRVIVERDEVVDRIFVYVALSRGRVLVSNDEMHIVFGPAREGGHPPRRRRLLRDSRRLRPRGAEILTSREAHSQI